VRAYVTQRTTARMKTAAPETGVQLKVSLEGQQMDQDRVVNRKAALCTNLVSKPSRRKLRGRKHEPLPDGYSDQSDGGELCAGLCGVGHVVTRSTETVCTRTSSSRLLNRKELVKERIDS
jgi:hypothetical protein